MSLIQTRRVGLCFAGLPPGGLCASLFIDDLGWACENSQRQRNAPLRGGLLERRLLVLARRASRLYEMTIHIHRTCVETAAACGTPGNSVHAADLAVFRRVADAVLDQGVV